MPDIEQLIYTIVEPLIVHTDQFEISVKETDDFLEFHLNLQPDDIGRVIGRRGRVIRAIRTIVYSIRNYSDKRTRIVVNDEE